MTWKQILCVALVLGFIPLGRACENPIQPIDGSHRAKYWELVYVGRVASISVPELEQTILPEDRSGYMYRGANKVVRVKVHETLKGSDEDIVEALLNWCVGWSIELGDVVALFGDGNYWEAVNDKSEIAEVRSTLASGSWHGTR